MKKATLAVLSAGAILAACGGNNNDNDAVALPTSEVPASASQSVDGMVAYLKLLVASSADMLEPVDTVMVTGPTDETSEPQAVD